METFSPPEVQHQPEVDSLPSLSHSRPVSDGEPEAKKRKVDLRRRHWFLTWNNPPPGGKDVLYSLGACKFVFQLEEGPSGTPHYQGVFSFVETKLWSTLNNALTPHGCWTPARNVAACRHYCSKVDSKRGKTYTKGYRVTAVLIDPLDGKTLYPFQKEILALVENEPDERSLYWYWSTEGNVGKSSLCKHLCLKHGALIVGGRHQDAYYAIASMVAKKKPPHIVVFDIPRSQGNEVSYTAIEGIKNGMFCSTKYETSMCLLNPPHVLVFANSHPDKTQLSADRWVIKCLDAPRHYSLFE